MKGTKQDKTDKQVEYDEYGRVKINKSGNEQEREVEKGDE